MYLIIVIFIILYIMRNIMPAKSPEITADIAHQLHTMGDRIRAQRKKLRINATVASEAAGMSRITWHRIEKGEPAVTMGAWMNAVTVVGLTLQIPETETTDADRQGWIPARIRLADYPELEKLAWHVHDAQDLSAREALDIYERNLRHLDAEALSAEESQLIEALRDAFGHTSGL